MIEREIDVVGLGNAIVDVLSHTEDEFLVRHGLTKGAMTLVDADRSHALYTRMKDTVVCSGGSAANTLVGLASFGGSAAFIGKVAGDELGRAFGADIRRAGVNFDTPALDGGADTGRCLVLVTPDAQRTMQTFLGASARLGPADVDPARIERARITYLEGYLWDAPAAKQAMHLAATLARGAGRKVALTLSDRFCVERHRQEFLGLIDAAVDVVFANREEALALFETEDLDEACGRLAERTEVAVVTMSGDGSVALRGGERVSIEPLALGPVLDTTGAGDLYASGFLFGLVRGLPLAACGRLGAIAAGEVISHFGARPVRPLAQLAAEHGS
jgi:sugar/nucleoside kinase (ribokinase family)